MHDDSTRALSETFGRACPDPAVAVVDGFGIELKVTRGHLVIHDGIGRQRRERRYSKAQRKLRRVVILGQGGYLTLDAIRWCSDVGVSITHIGDAARLLAV